MRKSVAKKAKPQKSKQNVNTVTVHDIINKVKEGQRTMDKKLEEIVQMCSPKELRNK